MKIVGHIYLVSERDSIAFCDDTGLDLPTGISCLVFADEDRPESVTVQSNDILTQDKPTYHEAPARLVWGSPYFTHY